MPITVTFQPTDEEEFIPLPEVDFPIEVEVSECLFAKQGGNLENMSEEDREEFNEFLHTVTPKQAIDEALTIISSAPAFDGIPVSEVDAPGIEASLSYENLQR